MEKVVSSLKDFKQRYGQKLGRKKKFVYVLRLLSLAAIFFLVAIDTQIIFNFLAGDRTFPRRITASSQTVAEAIDAERTRDKFIIREGLTSYFQQNHIYPNKLSLLVPSYISKIPMDPIANNEYNYRIVDSGADYTLCIYFETSFQCIDAQTTP
ncbi:MAG: hypothetical protein HYT11_03020 [Candidatus Levybacteria bacterium]|nr:hypothetical protein [Candidatus Levybacteria bacterium]